MSVNYGVTAVNDDGDVITSPATLSALYAGTVTSSITSGTQSFDFPSVPAGALYGLQMASTTKYGSGSHTWAISAVSGYCRITFTSVKQTYQSARATTVILFATNTFEPDYGINATNDFGERTISTIFPACKFIQRLTLGSTLSNFDTDAATRHAYLLSTTANAAEDATVFWSLPSSTDTSIWWAGATKATAGATVKMAALLPSDTAPTTRPEAFLFRLGPLTASTLWGIRVFNGAGEVMFDGATESLKIEAKITGVGFPSTGSNSYTLPSGYTPAFFMPKYSNEHHIGGFVDGLGVLQEKIGMMRRNGTTLYTTINIMHVDSEGWDERETTDDYYFGLSSGLFVPVVNANRYGGASI